MSQVSQFKKKSSVINRSPSPMISKSGNVGISGQHLSNQSQNYGPDFQKGKEKTESIMSSIIKDGLFEGSDVDLKKHVKHFSDIREREKTKIKEEQIPSFDIQTDEPSQNFQQQLEQQRQHQNSIIAQIQNSAVVQEQKSIVRSQNSEPKSQTQQPIDLLTNPPNSVAPNYSFQEKAPVKEVKKPQPKIDQVSAQEDLNKKLSLIDENVSKGPSFKEQIMAIKDQEKPDDNFYKKNLNLVLMVVTLKKIISRMHDENSELKKRKIEFDLRENEYQTKIRKLEMNIEEFQLKEKLWNKKPSDYIRFDLDDLNLKLKSIDENLDKASGDGLQERFLEDIVVKNKEYLMKNEENSNSLKLLKENLGNLKSTLLAMNQG